MSKKILIISSCTGQKTIQTAHALTLADFRAGEPVVEARQASFPELLTEAGSLYAGQQHLRLMRGIRKAEEAGLDIGLQILSAGYGLVDSRKKIFPYEVTFSGMNKRELLEWANGRNIPADFRRIIAQPYDLALILLGDSYLEACQWDESVQPGGPTLLFCGAAAAGRLPALPQLKIVPLSNQDPKRFSCGLVGLKGELGARTLLLLSANEALPTDPEQLLQKLETIRLPREPKHKLTAKPALSVLPPDPKVDWIIRLPETFDADVHRQRLQYFIPEWDDLVDPDYDFINEVHSGGTPDWSNEVFAHQLYPGPNYDGILISREVIKKNPKKELRLNRMGVHGYCRVPHNFPIMGDCGAFGYKDDPHPRYTTGEMLDYYTNLGFNFGVSVDHLILNDKQKDRYQLTINNAVEFLSEHKKRGLPWTPIGAVQGYDVQSYARAAEQYVQMGYQYIALGGLVRSKTTDVLKIAEEVVKVVPKSVKIHLFGLARLDASRVFKKLGITSVDSASHLRKAWMGAKDNYWTLDGKHYAAIRIPEVGKSHQANGMISKGMVTEAELRRIEQASLEAVRLYDRGILTSGRVIEVLQEYDEKMIHYDLMKQQDDNKKREQKGEPPKKIVLRPSMLKEYQRTLEAMPWKQCPCTLCREHGVEVILFRGNNRNRRRGFHNTFVFYRLLNQSASDSEFFINDKHQEFEDIYSKQLVLF